MKLKYLLPGLLSVFCILNSCQDPDDIGRTIEEDGSNVNILTVKGRFASDESKEYSAIIDRENGEVVVNVPYYMSDTEPIQGDLTKMKLNASLPVGAHIEPSLAGIYDLAAGVNFQLIYEDGKSEKYEVKAQYVKSPDANITAMTLTNLPRTQVRIVEENGVHEIIVYKTSSSMEEALKNAQLAFTLSPWSTISYKEGTVVDLTEPQSITVTAQDGTKKTYTIKMGFPQFVAEGEAGQITVLFGFQPSNNHPMGFESGKNRSLAVVDDELILGSQVNNLKRFNRYSGELLEGKTVNVSGVLSGGYFFAITSDDNGVLVGTTMAAAKNKWSLNTMLEFYAWKDGLDQAPVKLLSTDIMTDPALASLIPAGGGYDIGRTIGIKGDIVSGTAQIMVVAPQKQIVLRYKAENGKIQTAPELIKVSPSVGTGSKAIPVTSADNTPFVLSSANTSKYHYYVNSDRSIISFAPRMGSAPWWGSDTKGAAYIEFNGMKLLAVQNGNYSNNADANNRLVVGNIISMSPSSFQESQLMDSRLQNFDPNVEGAANATLTGMTSFYVSAAEGGAVGTNANKTGDVCFGRSSDGTAVQVYMLTTDHGIIAYDISKFADF